MSNYDRYIDIETRLANQVLDEEEQEIEDCPEMGESITGERLEKILAIVRQDKIEREAAAKKQSQEERFRHLPAAVFGR